MSTSSNNPPRVVVARSELQQCVDHINAMQAIIDGILERPEPQPVQTDEGGWPRLGWEAHDDPEQS